jgi:hypothetical protein
MTPAGNPAWTRTADHTFYGGDTDKRNFMSQGMIDARTDIGAAEITRLAEDLAACVRTAPFAVITYTCDDSTPGAPTVHAAYMMTGARTTSYVASSAPSGFPSAARNGDGDVTFTFGTSYEDAYGVSAELTIRHAEAGGHGTNAYGTVEISGATVRVRAANDAGAAVANAKVTLVVY